MDLLVLKLLPRRPAAPLPFRPDLRKIHAPQPAGVERDRGAGHIPANCLVGLGIHHTALYALASHQPNRFGPGYRATQGGGPNWLFVGGLVRSDVAQNLGGVLGRTDPFRFHGVCRGHGPVVVGAGIVVLSGGGRDRGSGRSRCQYGSRPTAIRRFSVMGGIYPRPQARRQCQRQPGCRSALGPCWCRGPFPRGPRRHHPWGAIPLLHCPGR